MPFLHVIVHWFLTPAAASKVSYNDVLIAIASVASVVWTGGLIAMQLKDSSITLINGLDYLQTAFLGSVLGMFVTGVPLRIIAIAYCTYHSATAIVSWRQARRQQLQGISQPSLSGDAEATIQYAAWTLISMLAYVAVVIEPTQFFMCIFGWVLLFLGMQMILSRLYGVDDDTFRRGKNWPYLLGLGSFVALVLIFWPRAD